MPASNQLLDGTLIRAEVTAGIFTWVTSDPGTGVLPSSRIVTWGEFKTHIGNTGTTQYTDLQCAPYSGMLAVRTIAAPSLTSLTNSSYCDGGAPNTAVYQVDLLWANGAGGNGTKIYRDGVYVDAVGSTITSYVMGLTDQGTYTIMIKHFAGSIESAGSSLTITIPSQLCA